MKTLLQVTFLLLLTPVAAWSQTATSFSTTASNIGYGTSITLKDTNFPANNCKTWQVSGAAHGTITQFSSGNGTLIYTPSPGYLGADSFDFTVTATPIVSGNCSGTPAISPAATVTIPAWIE